MTNPDRYRFLRALSPRAGAYALDFWRRRDELVVELKGPQDFVSHADRHSTSGAAATSSSSS